MGGFSLARGATAPRLPLHDARGALLWTPARDYLPGGGPRPRALPVGEERSAKASHSAAEAGLACRKSMWQTRTCGKQARGIADEAPSAEIGLPGALRARSVR